MNINVTLAIIPGAHTSGKQYNLLKKNYRSMPLLQGFVRPLLQGFLRRCNIITKNKQLFKNSDWLGVSCKRNTLVCY